MVYTKLNLSLLLLISSYIILCNGTQEEDTIIVKTVNGKLKGKLAFDWDKNLYYSFTSIPYAKPPLNELRFKAPLEAEPWEGILDATKPAPMCPQFYYEELVGEEDCLHLNVYTPKLNSSSKLPVMVYIHGGGYFVGTGSSQVYGPEFLMTENIVLVTIDYRLGHFGALSFEDQTQGVPGNAHMKDQVMALKWVKQNIRYFGGDENLVTIFGESVGGVSVHMHMLSPMSKGYLHRIISQSGCIGTPWSQGVVGTGEQVAKQFGITGTTKEKIQKLQQIPWEEFMLKTQKPDELTVELNSPHPFSPVVETQTNEPAFLPKAGLDLIPEASNNVPIMFGYNNNDSLLFQVMRRLYKGTPLIYLDELDRRIPYDLKIPNQKEREHVIEAIKETFFKQEANVGESVLFANGPYFITGYIHALTKHVAAKHNVYFYLFSTDTKLNFEKRLHPITARYKGASHMDELGHLLTTQYTPHFDKTSVEEQAWRATVRIWTDFARYGQPIHKDNSISKKNRVLDIKQEWPKVTDANDIVYGNINGNHVEVLHEPDKIVFDFWRRLYKKYNN